MHTKPLLLQGDWLLQSAASSTLGRQVHFMWAAEVQPHRLACIEHSNNAVEHARYMPLQIIALAKEMGIKTINQVHRDTYVQELKNLG